jgi:hypothetical protein
MQTTTTYRTKLTGRLDESLPSDYSPDDLRSYFAQVCALGIEPPKAAAEQWARLEDFRARARAAMEEPLDTVQSIGLALGRGDLTIKQAETRWPAAAVMRPADAQKHKRALFVQAARVAQDLTRRALHATPDEDLLAGPRAIMERALADHKNVDAQDQWDAALALAATLRALGVIARAEGASPEEYAFTRPDLSGKAPRLADIGDHAAEWGPRLLTGAEVLEAVALYAPHVTDGQEATAKKDEGKGFKRKGSVVWAPRPGRPGEHDAVAIKRG